jgi:hypothetical protein
MKQLHLHTPLNKTASPITGWTRTHWEEIFFHLMKGIVDSASPGCARQRIPGPRSHHGLLADELEGFTRSMIMAGPWLHGSKTGSYPWLKTEIDVADFYRKGILHGTDPRHPEYWGDIVDYAQHLVEMAALSWGLYLSKHLIWDKFSVDEKKQVADYLFQCTKVKYHQNNWLLFNVVTNTVLKVLGMPYSQEQIDANLTACDHMYMGEGWYRDGNINRIDYYNAWAFHYYYLQWVILDGASKPDVAEMHKERVRLFARDFRFFFSGDGSTPCFGRSMIYRFGSLAPLAFGQYLHCLDISQGEVKTMCNSLMGFYSSHPIITDQNHLSLGFLRPCAEILEHYSCGGSPYWATKAFNILMLPPDDPFWKIKEEKLPIHKDNYSVPLRNAGLLLLGDKQSGHVQLINQKSYHDKPEYNAKYTKFAYSSIFSYEARQVYKNFNCDNVLQFSEDGINFHQRWEMENLYCEKDFAASKYPLHNVDNEGCVYSYVLVKNDCMINFHQVETKKSLVFKEGGYPLGFDAGKAKTISLDGAEAAYKDGKWTFIRNLHGYTKQFKAVQFADDINGSNVRYRQSVVPALGYENMTTNKFYLAVMVCGKEGRESIKQLMAVVKRFSVRDNTAEILFSDGEIAFLQIGEIQHVTKTLNGKEISGQIVAARVSVDGKKWFVLDKAGKVDCQE